MLNKILLFVFYINFKEIISKDYNEICYAEIGSLERKFQILYFLDISFIPKSLYVELQIFEEPKEYIGSRMMEFNAQLTDEPCSNSTLIFPDTMKEPIIRAKLMIRLFYGEKIFVFERFNAIAWRGFKWKVLILEGMEGYARLPVTFSSKTKSLPKTEIILPKWYQKLPPLKPEEYYCIKLLKKGFQVILRINGPFLTSNNVYDYYFLKISSYKTALLSEIIDTKEYLVETFICKTIDPFNSLKIYLDFLTNSMSIELWNIDKDKSIQLVYNRHDKNLIQDTKSSQIILENLSAEIIAANIAIMDPQALLMYKTEKITTQCILKDEYSYIESYKNGEVVVRQFSNFGDDTAMKYKAYKMRPGREVEIKDCLG